MIKFLLFPLFIAVSGCTNNLSYKNVAGDKFLIRGDTVKVEKLTREDFKKLLDKAVSDDRYLMIKAINEANKKVENQKALMEAGRSSSYVPGMDLVILENLKKNLTEAKNSLKVFEDNRLMIRRYIGPLSDTPKVHAYYVSYTMIKTDLLGNKKILPRSNKEICFNPALSEEYKLAYKWRFYETIAQDIICKKYSKF